MVSEAGWIDVRWLRGPADLKALERIHAACFPGEGWTADDFRRYIDRPGRVARVIVTDGGEVIGSLLTKMTDDEVRITRVGVLPEYRRDRIASFAVRTITGPDSPHRRPVVLARVREDNLPAQLFLKRLRFECFTSEAGAYGPDVAGYWFRLVRQEASRRRRRLSAAVSVP